MNYLANDNLPETMPAIVCYGPEDYRLDEWAGAAACRRRSGDQGAVSRHLRQ